MDQQIPQLIGDAVQGASNVFAVTNASVKVTALVEGGLYRLRFDETITGSATVNINSIGATTIVNLATTATMSGDIQADVYIDLIFTEGDFVPAAPMRSDYLQSFGSFFVPAGAMTPRTTNGAEPLTVEFATNDIMVDQLAFDSSTEEGAQFPWRMPQDWDLGTVTAKFHWDGAAAATGTVIWGIRGRAYGNSAAIDQAFGTQITVTDTLITVGDVHLTPVTAAITLAGTPNVNDYIIFQIVATTGGTISVDQLLMGVTIQYGKTRNIISAFS